MLEIKKINRREIVKDMTMLAAMSGFAPFLNALPASSTSAGDGTTFLFQGDSITDGNRTRNNDWNHIMGHGYQYIIASKLWYEFPQKKFHFLNRGISGNKITDLAQRWQDDTIALKPDLLSVLVGINDVNAALNGDKSFTTQSYEDGYRALL